MTALGAAAEPSRLAARFLGNEAFELTDGKTTLLSDFPYQSGAFGYMTYDPAELRGRTSSLCLITHAHADHFDAPLAAKVGCDVLGPSSVLAKVTKARALEAVGPVRFADLVILPVATDHGGEPHFSYLVEWSGRRLYFTGDTESTAELSRQGPLDVLFISPWLLAAARRQGKLPEARRIVVYHQQPGEKIANCSGTCVVPEQGQTIVIDGS